MSKNTIHRIFSITLISIILYIALVAWEVTYPFLIAAIVAYILDPILKNIEKNFKVPRSYTIYLILILMLSLFYYTYKYLVNININSILNSQGYYIQKYLLLLDKIQYMILNNIFHITNDNSYDLIIKKGFSTLKNTILLKVPSLVLNITSTVINSILNIFIIIISTVFILQSKNNIKSSLKYYIPTDDLDNIKKLFQTIHEYIIKYIQGLIIITLISALSVAIIVGIFDEISQYTVTCFIFTLITNPIPYIGPLLVMLLPILLSIIKMKYINISIVALYTLTTNILINMIIYPKIIGSQVSIHPIIIVISVILGNYFIGIIGMILAIPIVIILKTITDFIVKEINNL